MQNGQSPMTGFTVPRLVDLHYQSAVSKRGQVRCCLLQEQPQLENDRSHLLQLIANDQMVLRDLEDKSLSLLQKSQGNMKGLWARSNI